MESDRSASTLEEENPPSGCSGSSPGLDASASSESGSQGIEGGVVKETVTNSPQISGSCEPLATALPLELLTERFFRWDRSRHDLEGAVRRVLRVDPDGDLGLLHHSPEAAPYVRQQGTKRLPKPSKNLFIKRWHGAFASERGSAHGTGKTAEEHNEAAAAARDFLEVYHRFLTEVVSKEMNLPPDTELIFQKTPTFRCCFPNSAALGHRCMSQSVL